MSGNTSRLSRRMNISPGKLSMRIICGVRGVARNEKPIPMPDEMPISIRMNRQCERRQVQHCGTGQRVSQGAGRQRDGVSRAGCARGQGVMGERVALRSAAQIVFRSETGVGACADR